jgi:hypothetical protein
MRTIQEYLRHAEECDALARVTTSGERREQIIRMAETWRMLAEERRKKLAKLDGLPPDAPATTQDYSNRKE